MNNQLSTQILQLFRQLSEPNQYRVLRHVANLVKAERELQKQAIAAASPIESDG